MTNKPKTFAKGFKTWAILCEMKRLNGMSYSQIIKMAFEMSNGRGTFDKVENRGYWSGAFVDHSNSQWPWVDKSVKGPIAKYAFKDNDGKYRVNEKGNTFINNNMNNF